VGAQVDLLRLAALVGDSLLDQVAAEHPAIEQELVIGPQCVHRLRQRAAEVDDLR
jgi:hypothetical protein